MIISRGRRYIFVHIPKTGGTSMALALESRAMKDDIMLGDTPKAVKRRRRLKHLQTRGRLWKHSTLADIEGLVSARELDDLFLFTLVRNPWDRMVSYYHWLRDQSFEHPAVHLARQLPFSAFVAHPNTLASFERSPASFYLTDAAGTERAATYVRLEHLEEDLGAVQAHLGFSLELGHSNRSERRQDWRSYYTDDTAEAVAIVCKQDIAQFGYSFDS